MERKERPIIFQAEEVKGILEGRKTQFRRIVELKNDTIVDVFDDDYLAEKGFAAFDTKRFHARHIKCPFGKVSDRLRVREPWKMWECQKTLKDYAIYEVGDTKTLMPNTLAASNFVVGRFNSWQYPENMPRWASRLTLEITNIRVERLQDISEEDAKAEGCRNKSDVIGSENVGGYWGNGEPCARSRYGYRTTFQLLWNKINGKGSWESSPYVWVIEFKSNGR